MKLSSWLILFQLVFLPLAEARRVKGATRILQADTENPETQVAEPLEDSGKGCKGGKGKGKGKSDRQRALSRNKGCPTPSPTPSPTPTPPPRGSYISNDILPPSSSPSYLDDSRKRALTGTVGNVRRSSNTRNK